MAVPDKQNLRLLEEDYTSLKLLQLHVIINGYLSVSFAIFQQNSKLF